MADRARTKTPILGSGDRTAARSLIPTIGREAAAPGAAADPGESARTIPRLPVEPPSSSSPPPPDDLVSRLNTAQALGLGDLAQEVDRRIRHLLESDPPGVEDQELLLVLVRDLGAKVKQLLEVMRVGG